MTYAEVQRLFVYKPDGYLEWARTTGPRARKGTIAGSASKKDGRRQIIYKKKSYKAARLIFLFHNGFLPEMVDHIDGDPSNDRIENLREATRADNGANQKRNLPRKDGARFKGVYAAGKKWYASLQKNRKVYRTKRFDSEIEAAKAYNSLAKEHFGDYARLNEI